MDTKAITDYLKELDNPSLKCLPNEPINPMDIKQYLAKVETLRLAFVSEVLGCSNEALVSVYVDELKQAVKTVQQRGYHKLKDENITAAIMGGVKEMELVNDVVLVDRGLLASAEKALKVLLPTKEDAYDTVAEPRVPKKKEITKDVAKDSPIISGTVGLAKFLGCGKSMAFSIIKNGILKEQGIQYMVGKSWKFNREKLEQYITEHPELLANVRCKK